jgi:hypothetical protein
MTFEQNVDRDAGLVVMCMAGAQVPAGIRFGLTPDELLAHGEWLRAQPGEYIDRVVRRVEEMQS